MSVNIPDSYNSQSALGEEELIRKLPRRSFNRLDSSNLSPKRSTELESISKISPEESKATTPRVLANTSEESEYWYRVVVVEPTERELPGWVPTGSL